MVFFFRKVYPQLPLCFSGIAHLKQILPEDFSVLYTRFQFNAMQCSISNKVLDLSLQSDWLEGDFLQGLIQKEKVNIGGKKGAQISIVIKRL